MFNIGDVVCFKNANKWGTREFKILEIDSSNQVMLDNGLWYSDNLIVLC